MATVGHVRNSLFIAFLAFLDQYDFFFCKMAASWHFVRKSLVIAFLAISDRSVILDVWHSWQNGCRRPFWMSEFHFRSHFWPFQIDTQLFIFFWQNGYRRPCPKFTFYRISGHFRSIRIFFLQNGRQLTFCSKITRDCISGHFRSISDFGCLKFTFDSNFGHFRSIHNIVFFRRPFWMSENHFWLHFRPFLIDRPFWMSEIHFRWHFWPFHIHTDLNICLKFLTKWSPAAILDVRKSLSIAFLAISDRYATLLF